MTINFKKIGALVKVERTGYPDIYINPNGNIQLVLRYYEDTEKWAITIGIEVNNVLNDITDIQVDGVAVTDQADFETKIATVFPDAGGSASTTPTDITYADLETAISASTLTPGAQYIISDFATKHYVFDGGGTQYLDTIITGATEPLLVTAIAANKISHEAKSALYPQDIIHYDPDFSNWDQDIAFADLTTPASPVAVTGFKGVIYFRHDTLLDNYMPYDFRNCKFRRWNDGTGYYAINSNSAGVTDTEDYLDQKTFVETGATGLYEICCRANHFESFKDSNDLYNYIPSILLNNIVYLSDDGWYTFISNSFGAGCYNNTFKGYAESNTIGNIFGSNTIGDLFMGNTIGSSFQYNTIGNNFRYNTIGFNFQSNTIGNNFRFNNAKDNVSTVINYSSATHVYASYSCEIFKRADGTAKLSYVDNTDTLIIVNANA